MWVRVRERVNMYMRAYIYVYAHLYMYVCIYVYIYVYIDIYEGKDNNVWSAHVCASERMGGRGWERVGEGERG